MTDIFNMHMKLNTLIENLHVLIEAPTSYGNSYLQRNKTLCVTITSASLLIAPFSYIFVEINLHLQT